MVKFSLNPEISDQIIFAMENQNEYFVFDAKDGVVVSPDDDSEELAAQNDGRYYDLPSWEPSDGFLLMEKFVAGLRNPVYREQLKEALNSGHGVFRSFKDVLRQREDIQRLWYAFKDREMKNVVIEWYNSLCEIWGIEKIGPEPEETDELVLSDFILRADTDPSAVDGYLEMDRAGFEEAMADFHADYVEARYRERVLSVPAPREEWSFMVSETPEGECAGMLWSVHRENRPGGPTVTWVIQLYVRPEFRGLGIARTMVNTFMKDCYRRGSRRMTVRLWGGSLGFGRVFEECGFIQESAGYTLDMDAWGRDNRGG
ncbi:MAG: GNAT family N-acetyltransferase [Spirochaetales bacterium]|nr:GNAT family N-acetyltransferase [Spirochaetales bacterium]